MPFKPAKSEHADKGKEAEDAVQAFLEDYSAKHAAFDYMRLPDAKAARGRMKAMPADFDFHTPLTHGLLEVKETKHDFRLTRAKVPQLPKLLKRHKAGGRCYVVTYHSETGKWRCVPAHHLDPGATSWDLSGYALYDNVVDALRGFLDD